MEKLALILGVLVGAIPAAILSYLLRSVFPHMGLWPTALIAGAIALGVGFWFIRRQKAFYEGGNGLPGWLESANLYLILGTILGSAMVSSSNRAELYIDNATDKAVTIKIKDETDFTVEPMQFKHISVGAIPQQMDINGKNETLNITSEGNWIYNVDTANTYIATSIEYGTSSASPSDKMPEMKMVKELFFKSDADYIFDSPESIKVKGNNKVTKTVLFRRNSNGEN
jgi:hypothetical protein